MKQNLVLDAVKEKKLEQMKALRDKNEALGMGGLMKHTAEIGNLGAVFNVRVSQSSNQFIESQEEEIYQTTQAASVYKPTTAGSAHKVITEGSVESGAVFNQAVPLPPLPFTTNEEKTPYRKSLKEIQDKRQNRVLSSSQIYRDAEDMDDMLRQMENQHAFD